MSRGKKILKMLNLNAGEVQKNSEKHMEEYEFREEEEDPWFYFKQWKSKVTKVDNFEIDKRTIVLEELATINNRKRDKSPEKACSESSNLEICTDSLRSWKPTGEVETTDDTSTSNSEKSEIIRRIKPRMIKQKIGKDYVDIQFGKLDLKVSESVQSKEKKEAKRNLMRIKVPLEDPNKRNNFERPCTSAQTTETSTVNTTITPQSVETSRRKGRVWDRKDRCLYCKQDITNFSRHLFRKHSNEERIIKIMQYPKGNNERKKLIDLLRKEGNFSVYYENTIRPVQRPSSNFNKDFIASEDYLPCKYCVGLYKKQSLSRHAKKCFLNHEKVTGQMRYRSEGQTILALTESRKKFFSRLRLKTEVFNKMHADRVSLNGKNDPIVCQYAEDYLRKHKRPHIQNLVSNKIRELGRLLIPLQDIYKINSMLEALTPENFDKVVSAARIISGYDDATKTFKSASLALHLRTILLAVCSSAKTLLLKKDPILPVTDYDKVLRDLKGFCELVASNWKFEMGSLALKDLNEKHSVNPQKLPITSDIILFKNYCHNVASNAMKNLIDKAEDIDSFKRLSEATLALTILINRKRVGDVQYTKLESYSKSPTNNNQGELLNVLTETEKELTKHFKRIMTVGKGSKSVAILFPKPIQEYINVMLTVRNNTTFIPKENPFLFALVGSPSKWIDGSTILRKYATACGAKNPQTLTSSRLRKQIATVLQILNLNETEMEQIASFMGHTRKTHQEFYRLPQELYQTSKIAKLLLTMEKGINKEDEGKTLDELDIQIKILGESKEPNDKTEKNQTVNKPEKEQDAVESVEDQSVNEVNKETDVEHFPILSTNQNQDKRKHRGSWSTRQRNVMLNFFKKHIKKQIPPKKSECLEFQQKYIELFEKKTWIQIKVFVYNTYRTKK